MIFNTSINTGIFPYDFKTAVISPIHKAGCKTECRNYRPISVLSNVAKIFKKLITQQLEIYLETNEILVQQQVGFRKKQCTQTSLLSITNQWFINMDRGSLNGVIFLDLKKAFDCVDHNRPSSEHKIQTKLTNSFRLLTRHAVSQGLQTRASSSGYVSS